RMEKILRIIGLAILQIADVIGPDSEPVTTAAASNDPIPEAPVILAPTAADSSDPIPEAPGSGPEPERMVEIDTQGIPWTEGLHRKNRGTYSRKTGIYPKGSWIIQPGVGKQAAADQTAALIKQHVAGTPAPDEVCITCGVSKPCGCRPDGTACKAAIEKLNSTPPAAPAAPAERKPRRVIVGEIEPTFEQLNEAMNNSDCVDPGILKACCKFAGVKTWMELEAKPHKGGKIENYPAVGMAYSFLVKKGVIEKITGPIGSEGE
ncbi:MAG: hypothetical protein GY795_06330, partial [Desulfobacterales bacterium]|nr:hypothetical protein [Desulfobacterales bacterium]